MRRRRERTLDVWFTLTIAKRAFAVGIELRLPVRE